MLRWIFRLAALLLFLAIGYSAFETRHKHSSEQLDMLSDRLFEFGAVDFVHSSYEGQQKALFDCVAQGQPLNEEQSRRYRLTYQQALLKRQKMFAALDQNLQLRRDEGKDRRNNAGGFGICGLHDHHDASARENVHDIERGLQRLQHAGAIGRAAAAYDIYKDLTDLMVHMAPAVHSVGLLGPDAERLRLSAPLKAQYQEFYDAMKRAQGQPLNSPAYWAEVTQGVQAYSALVADVQSRVRARNGWALHTLSGQWLSLQTIAPRLSQSSPSAQSRKRAGSSAGICVE